ncbi:MAG: hypothetical protein CFE46_10515 [Burkholderiales bacterium PBB6]|nr:MAG: hypothetical protein CFE46_10515 [Burkholderiales bacterium PBB6]
MSLGRRGLLRRLSSVAVVAGLMLGLAACQPAAPHATVDVAASASQAVAPQASSGAASAPLPLATRHAAALELLQHHRGVLSGTLNGQAAWLWISDGATLRRGDEAVTLPRMVLYRAALAGQPGVMVEVMVEVMPRAGSAADGWPLCPLFTGTGAEGATTDCEAASTLLLPEGPVPAQPGGALEVRLSAAGTAMPARFVHTPPPANPPKDERDLFDAALASDARPQGEVQQRGQTRWRPMKHAVSGVEWDRVIATAEPATLAEIQRQVDRRAASLVGEALENQASGRDAQARFRVRYASTRWLVMEAAQSAVGATSRAGFESHPVWDLASGKPVRFADGFRYATLKRLDGSIALDLGNAPAPGADADRGLLGATLRALGPRREGRCLQRWLQAHGCVLPGRCEALPAVPHDLVAFPTDDGLALQFNHAGIEREAQQTSRPLPPELTGPSWSNCVEDQVLVPWPQALQARRSDSRIELP